jgi:hypothetical protein
MKQDNWKAWHDRDWTEFETHSAIFGALRKKHKGTYIVRGQYVFISKDGKQIRPDIAIFKIEEKGRPATLKMVIEVKREGNKLDPSAQCALYEKVLGVPCIVVTGKEGLVNIHETVDAILYKGIL